jgi:lipoprotein-anchoring transpeptidase ErfK/SrfK
MKHLLLVPAFLMGMIPVVAYAERTVTVNFSTATLTVTENNQTVMQTAVVLPRGNYYPVPVSGTITSSVMGPTWTPTANMHRDMPGRYRQSYGPYQAGNAMGHCKVSINFDIAHRLLPHVRIHGNAKQEDLGLRRSRSCIRVPNSLCQQLVNATAGHGNVRVHFTQ